MLRSFLFVALNKDSRISALVSLKIQKDYDILNLSDEVHHKIHSDIH